VEYDKLGCALPVKNTEEFENAINLLLESSNSDARNLHARLREARKNSCPLPGRPKI